MMKVLRALQARPAAASGVLLLIATVVAVIWANSSAQGAYHQLWAQTFRIGVGEFELAKPLVLWVNDLLMAIFFLLVGLEIKREAMEGELSSLRRAALPMAAAVGGVVVPASIYVAINSAPGGDFAGWAVPAATDIAFALGILALLGTRVPLLLKVFLTTVAVVDDLVAVLIIAAFFTSTISWSALLVAAITFAALVATNMAGVRRPLPYVLLGIVLWVAVLKSGLHATLAGVMLAATIPLRRSLTATEFVERLRRLVGTTNRETGQGVAPDTMGHRAREVCNRFESPVVRWEHAIQPAVLFFIVPVFALANAGVTISSGEGSGIGPVGLGVGLGLLLGKPIGVTGCAWLAVRLGLAELPRGLTWHQLHAASWLAGIGFTMSLFIAGLALQGASLEAARIGLLVGSGLAAGIGAVMVWRSCPAPATESANNLPEPQGARPQGAE